MHKGDMSMNQPKVFADFHNADYKGRLRLNCTGTISDLAHQKVLLQDGKNLMLYSEDVEVGVLNTLQRKAFGLL
jgi:hypothetical protein